MDTKDRHLSPGIHTISNDYLTPLDIRSIYLDTDMSKKRKNRISTYCHLKPSSAAEPNLYSPIRMGEEDSAFSYEMIDSPTDNQKAYCDLTGKSLTTIPKVVVENGNIRTLILDQNRFGVLPSDIYGMVNLQVISAAAQMEPESSRSPFPALHHIPPGIEHLKELSHLLLFNNALRNLPEFFFKLQRLIHLDLRLNLIADFPQCFCKMPNLKELYLSGNKIHIIPREINQMNDLEVLILDNNEVENIPEELCELKKLTYLSLQNNRISVLPVQLTQLDLLPHEAETEQNRRFFIEGNPLSYPLKDHTKTAQAIFKYLKNLQSDQQLVEEDYGAEVKRKTAYYHPESAKTAATHPGLIQYMKENGLVFRETTTGGGNGFFHALADQLRRPDMDLQHFTHAELRQNLVDYLKSIPEESQKRNYLQAEQHQEIPDFMAWLQTNQNTTLEAYVNRLSEDGVEADVVTMKAAALMLQRNICVITSVPCSLATSENPLSSVWCNTYTGGDGKIHHIAYFHSHFQSLGHSEEEKPYDDTETATTIDSENNSTVDYSCQSLSKLPPSLTKQSSTQRLNLRGNHLTCTSWWSDLESLPKIQSLDISEQKPENEWRCYKWLIDIPKEIYNYLPNLTELVLSENRISYLPMELSFIKSLQLLDFINNYIAEIPTELCDLPHLEYLGLSSNRLNHLPENIGNLTTLLVLRLSHNRLEELPDSICDLHQLQVLSLSSNKLCMLPLQFHKLKNLMSDKVYKNSILPQSEFHAKLWIEGNDDTIKYPTPSICKRGTKYILDYLEKMENRPDDRDKIICNIKGDSSSSQAKLEAAVTTSRFQHLTDTFLEKLSRQLGNEWRTLGISLDFEYSQLEIIEGDFPKQTQQAISKMLHEWRNRNCGHLSEEKMLKQLFSALGEVGREDLKHKLDKTYRRLSQVS